MSRKKCFLVGFFGAALFALVVFLVLPFYSDYRARAESSKWLILARPLRNTIATRALQNKTLLDTSREEIDPALRKSLTEAGVKVLEINATGTIFMSGGRDGQLLVLIPELEAQPLRVTWRCLGGSRKAMPPRCRP